MGINLSLDELETVLAGAFGRVIQGDTGAKIIEEAKNKITLFVAYSRGPRLVDKLVIPKINLGAEGQHAKDLRKLFDATDVSYQESDNAQYISSSARWELYFPSPANAMDLLSHLNLNLYDESKETHGFSVESGIERVLSINSDAFSYRGNESYNVVALAEYCVNSNDSARLRLIDALDKYGSKENPVTIKLLE